MYNILCKQGVGLLLTNLKKGVLMNNKRVREYLVIALLVIKILETVLKLL